MCVRLLLFALWLAVLATLLGGCRKPTGATEETVSNHEYSAPGVQVLSDGIVTCELSKDQFGHVYERSGISLERCFSIWLMDNAGQDHGEEWFHKQYGDPFNQEGRTQAQKHLLGRS